MVCDIRQITVEHRGHFSGCVVARADIGHAQGCRHAHRREDDIRIISHIVIEKVEAEVVGVVDERLVVRLGDVRSGISHLIRQGHLETVVCAAVILATVNVAYGGTKVREEFDLWAELTATQRTSFQAMYDRLAQRLQTVYLA